MAPPIPGSALPEANGAAQDDQKLPLNEHVDSADSTSTYAPATSSSFPLPPTKSASTKSASTIDQCNMTKTKNIAHNTNTREEDSNPDQISNKINYKDIASNEATHNGNCHKRRTNSRTCEDHSLPDETSDNDDGGASITTPSSSIDLSAQEQGIIEANGPELKKIEAIPNVREKAASDFTTVPVAPTPNQSLTPPELSGPPNYMILRRELMNRLQFCSNAVTTKPRSQSSSTRDVSRFFPMQQTGLDPQAANWQLPQGASVFDTLNSPASSDFPEGITGFNMPLPTLDPEDTTINHRRISESSWDNQNPEHKPCGQVGYQLHVCADDSNIAAETRQGSSKENTKAQDLRPSSAAQSHINLQVSTAVNQALSPGIPTISRLTSPSQDHQFLPPEQSRQIGSSSQFPASPPNSARATKGVWVFQTSHAFPVLPRGSTTIGDIEKAAEGAGVQKTLATTRPASSWVTNLQDWRSRGPIRGYGRDETASLQSLLPINGSELDSVVATPESARYPSVRTLGVNSSQTFAPTVPSHTSVSGNIAFSRSHKPFKPMNSILYPEAAKKPLTQEEVASREEKGISRNYQGNPYNPKNRSADIPDAENCALFLTNLPAKCTYQDLLQALAQHRVGRVWSTYINPPRTAADQHKHDQENLACMGKIAEQTTTHPDVVGQSTRPLLPAPTCTGRLPLSYSTSAAKVIFYHPLEAQRLMVLAERSEFRIHGRRIAAKYNRHKTPAQIYENPTSRVLLISGPASIVRKEYLNTLYAQYFEYQTEEVIVVAEGNNWSILEWRFGSMRAQAHSAYQLLKSLYPGIVTVKWAVDPCAGYMVLDERQPPAGQFFAGE